MGGVIENKEGQYEKGNDKGVFDGYEDDIEQWT